MTQLLAGYVKDNKVWLKIAIRLFLISAVTGAVSYFYKPDLINEITKVFADKFGANPVPNFSLARQVFLQNSLVSILAALGGVFFGISSFFIVFVNGFIIGFIILSVLASSPDFLSNTIFLVLGLAPHGIFEIPAFLISSAIGLRLGIEWMSKGSHGRRFSVWKKDLARALKVLPFVFAILLVAALVEIFVSGKILGGF
jgi:stage II sporulation protein M